MMPIKLVGFLRFFKTSNIRSFIYQTNPFWIQLVYFLFLSVFGYLALKISTPRTPEKLNDLDIFFTSVSSATVSSMSTLEMEVFSNTQLIIITILMLVGGEVFISMLGLFFSLHKTLSNPQTPHFPGQELGPFSGDSDQKPEKDDIENNAILSLDHRDGLNFAAIKFLGYVVLGYFLVVHLIGSSLVAIYSSSVPSVRKLLAEKKLYVETFSMFVTVSTFANCGFLPTNENMVVFKKNSGLLMILIPQVLLGNTLYAPSLRFLIWVLEKFTKREEFRYLLRNNREIGYAHLLPNVRCWFVAITVFGFIAVQFVVFCCLEWNSSLMDGMNTYEKITAVIFQVVNARHTGESVFDLSIISTAILVIFVVMMYLPSYTSYWPKNEEEESEKSGRELRKEKKKKGIQLLIFSQLSYLIIAIILVCVVEAQNLKTDPLNFNVLNITIEVISAYGNVGFSTGYSCERQIREEGSCKNEWIGFVGKWSNFGKIILILVMFFGKLKQFSKNGGQAWKLS